MKRLVTILSLVILSAVNLQAQNLMVVHQGNGTQLQIPLESIDSVRFVLEPPPAVQKIFQNNGNVLSVAITDIDSITYTLPNAQNLAQITTQSVTVLSSTTAYGGGSISGNGGSEVTQRGVCWSTTPNPTLANNFTINGNGNGTFGSNILPLQPATTYFVRAYAVNASGTAYGNTESFTTQNPSGAGMLPVVATDNLIYYDGLEASCGGLIIADGGLEITAQGLCWAVGSIPTINNFISMSQLGLGSYSNTLSNLIPGTTYFVRAFATNDAGTAYGITYNFTTNSLPFVSTNLVTEITAGSAISGGVIEDDGGSEFIQGGICFGTEHLPTLSNSVVYSSDILGSFTSNLNTLIHNTTYYVRAYATNGVGTAYGNEQTFTTLSGDGGGEPASCGAIDVHNPILNYETMADQEGNIYKTIQIGFQKWMAENLKTSVYRNGDSIFNITNGSQLMYNNTNDYPDYWCNYNFDPQYDCPFGKLYSWWAFVDSRNICPAGWHIPSIEEWNTLKNYLDANILAGNTSGGSMKSSGTAQYWDFPNQEATNESGFSGLPGGRQLTGLYNTGYCAEMGQSGYWWGYANTPFFVDESLISLNSSTGVLYCGSSGGGNIKAMSIRCINDTTLQEGSIDSIDCSSTFNNGELTIGESANNLTSSIPYYGGNGGSHAGQIINSTGLLGLTATLVPGNFTTGSGYLVYNITGTPTSMGTAYFNLNINGQFCTFGVTVNSAASCGAGEVHNPNLSYGSMNDQAGNIYKTIVIGTQEWMAENLKTSIYRNGDTIANVTDNAQWANLTAGAWCYFNNDNQFDCPYGKLYNWYAVADPRNLCPTGWHVPTDAEWSVLINYLDPSAAGGEIFNTAGGKLKSIGLQYWLSPNQDATNESGFSGLPGGSRYYDGTFYDVGSLGYWWSSSEGNTFNAWSRYLYFYSGDVIRYYDSKEAGFSVRCLRD